MASDPSSSSAASLPSSGAADTWHVYIARCADDTLYTGIARDADARVAQHNAGRGARYTRGRGPLELVYCERVTGRGPALRREAAIKALSVAGKRRLIAGHASSRRSPAARARSTIASRRG